MSAMAMFQQLTMHAPVQPSLSPVGVRAEAAKRVAEVSAKQGYCFRWIVSL